LEIGGRIVGKDEAKVMLLRYKERLLDAVV